jgi:alpha-tubulin suppressor-like RCC1 family protein
VYSFVSDKYRQLSDGGVLEISIGSSSYTDIISAGGSFVSVGYNDTLSIYGTNPLRGRQAWSGRSAGFMWDHPNGLITTIVNLPASASGQTVRFRWRAGSETCAGTQWAINTIRVTDGYSCTSNCSCPVISVTPEKLPVGVATVPYSQVLTARGGVAPYRYAVVSGTLPVGITFSSNGLLSGTPTTIGSYGFTVQVTDSSGCKSNHLINVLIGRPRIMLEENFDGITTPNLPLGWTSIRASGSTPLWTTTNLSSDTTSNSVFIPIPSTNRNGSSDISLISPPISITTVSAQLSFRHNYKFFDRIDGGVLEIAIGNNDYIDIISSGGSIVSGGYNQTITEYNNSNPLRVRKAWSGNSEGFITTVVNLPASAAGKSIRLRWRIGSSGRDQPPGQEMYWYVDTIRLTDDYLCDADCTCPTILVAPSNLPLGMATIPYSQVLTSSGGVAPYAYALASGTLPTGITLSNAGLISGTPTTTGNYMFTVQVTDSSGCRSDQLISIIIGRPRFALEENFDGVTVPNLPLGWSSTRASGTAPLWSTIRDSVDTITNGAYVINPSTTSDIYLNSPEVTITSSFAQLSFNHDYSLETEHDGGVLEIAVGNKDFIDIIAAGGSFLSGGYNIGLKVETTNPIRGRQAWSGSSGRIITTIVNLPASAVGQKVRFRWRIGSDSQYAYGKWYIDRIKLIDGYACTVDCTCPTISLVSGTLPVGATTVAYSYFLTARGGIGPYTYKIASGIIPPGITLSLDGRLSGIPTTIGSYNFTVRMADDSGCENSQSVNLSIGHPKLVFQEDFDAITVPNLPSGWTSSTTAGTTPLWVTTNLASSSIPNSAYIRTSSSSDTYLISPSISITNPLAQISFSHFMNINSGVLEIAIGSSGFTDIITAGGTFLSGKYNATLSSDSTHPLYGRSVWSGNSKTYFTTSVNLPASAVGKTVKFRWRMVYTPDPDISDDEDFWYIDTIKVSEGNACIADCICSTITLGVLPVGTASAYYSHILNANGGIAPYTYKVVSGKLPTGISFSSAGLFSGTPIAYGRYAFTVQVRDSNGCENIQLMNLTIGQPRIRLQENFDGITIPNLPTGWTTTRASGSTPLWVTTQTYPGGKYINQEGSAFVPNHLTSSDIYLNSPTIFITTTQAQLSFRHSYKFGSTYWQGEIDGGVLEIAIGSSDFTDIISAGGSFVSGGYDSVLFNDVTNSLGGRQAWGGGGDEFITTIVNLPASAAGQPVRFRWRMGSADKKEYGLNYSESGWRIDFIRLIDGNTCTTECTCPSITLGALPVAAVTTSYSQSITASGGTWPYTYTLASGSLPTGLDLALDGVLSGTPVIAGSYSFTVRVRDSGGCESNQLINLQIGRPKIELEQYFDGLTAPNLPSGWTSTRASSTTPLWVSRYYSSNDITAFVPSVSTTSDISLISPTLSIITSSAQLRFRHYYDLEAPYDGGVLEIAIGNAEFTDIISAGGSFNSGGYNTTLRIEGTNPLRGRTTWSGNSSGFITTVVNLPASAAGRIVRFRWRMGSDGKDDGRNRYGWFVDAIRLTDGYACTVDCACPTISVIPGTLPVGATSVTYSHLLTASGGLAPYTYTLISGTLPNGIALTLNGLLFGTPTTFGSYTFTIRVTDSSGCVNTQLMNLTIGRPRIALQENFDDAYDGRTTKSLPSGWTSTRVSDSTPYWVAALAEFKNYTAYISNPSITSDISLISPSIFITTSFAQLSFIHSYVFDAGQYSINDGGVLEIAIGNADFADIISVGGSFVKGGYNSTISNYGTNPLRGRQAWSGNSWKNNSSGFMTTVVNLPSLAAGQTVRLRWRLGANHYNETRASGWSVDTIKLTDGNTCIDDCTCPTISLGPKTLPDGRIRQTYSQSLSGSGGIPPYKYTVISGALPPGISLSTEGILYGVPSISGKYTFTVRVEDEYGCAIEQVMSLSITCQTIEFRQSNFVVFLGVFYDGNVTVYPSGVYNYEVVTGSLPPGLILNASSGRISGIPTVTGSYSLTIRATDEGGCSGIYPITITSICVWQRLSSLDNGRVGQLYDGTVKSITAGANSYEIVVGSLPPGLILDASTGRVSGMPTVSGSFDFRVKVTNINGCTSSQAYTLIIACPTIKVSSPNGLGTLNVGTSFTGSFTSSGGTVPVTYKTVSTLPIGMTLASDGTLSGMPMVVGNFPITVTATGVNGCTGSVTVTLVVSCQTVTLSPISLPRGIVGSAYSQGVTVSPSGSYTYAVTSGTLPGGLILNSTTGVITGTPTTVGSSTFTVTATGPGSCTGSQQYTLAIICATITLTPPSGTTNMTLGTTFSGNFTAIGASAPVSYSTTSTLPSGLTLALDGKLSGTPTSVGSFPINVTMTDFNGCKVTITTTLTISCGTVTLSPTTLPVATTTAAYNQTLTVAQSGTYTFAVTAGTLPSGLSLNQVTGAITGIPTTSGLSSFTVTATSTNGCNGSRQYTLFVDCPTITVTAPTTLTGTLGTAYSQSFTSSGGAGTKTYTTTSILPAGMVLAANGTLSGTPTQSGSFLVTVTVTDDNGCTGSMAISLVVGCSTLTVTAPTTLTGTPGTAYSQSFTSSGGAGTKTYTTNSTLPAGMVLATNGTLSGTPTQSGSFLITVTVTDGNGCTGSVTATLTISCPTISLGALGGGIQGAAYSGSVGAALLSVYTYAVTSGNLPTGLSLNSSTGAITGTPTAAGSFTFTVTATGIGDCTVSKSYTLIVSSVSGVGMTVFSGLTRIIGSPVSNSTIATVTGFVASPPVSVGTPNTQNGVTISGVVNNSGTVSANIAVACGAQNASFTLKLCDSSTVQAWGNNSFNQSTVPSSLTQVVAVSAGHYHNLALRSNGTVVGWGYRPAVPSGLSGVTAISAGGYHNLALKSDGTVVAWGDNSNGEATVPAGLTGVKAIAAGNANSFALKSDGSIVAWGWNGDGQTTVPAGLTGVKAIAAGWYHTIALKNDGTVVAWGKNINGTTNVPSGLTGVVAIAAGAYHSLALKSDGTVIAWGDDGSGQISVPTGLSGVRAISAGVAFSLAVREDGTIVAWGGNNYGQVNVPTGLTGIVAASGGTNHSIVLKCDGSTGTLNVGADSNVHPVLTYSSTAVSIIAGASAVISPVTGPTDNGSVSSITVHSKGTFTGTVGVDAAGQVSISSAAPGGTHILTIRVTDNCGATTDATINLVVADTCPTITVTAPTTLNGTVGTAYSQSFTSSGGAGTKIYTTTSTLPSGITLSTNGTLSGTPTQTGSFPITVTVTDGNGCPGTVMATLTISCPTILLGTLQGGVLGEVYNGSVGAISEGIYTYEVTEGSLPAGLTLNSLTGFITGTPTVVGTITFSVKASVGNCTANKSYTLTVSSASTVGMTVMSGLRRISGSSASSSTIAMVTGYAASPPVSVESPNSQNGITLSGIVNNSGTVSANIAATCGAQNASFTLKLCDNSTVQSWGDNGFNQSVVPSELTQIVAVSAGHYHNLALRSNGTVVNWGYNLANKLSVPSGLSGVTAISAGGYHNLALKSDGTVVAWGENSNGEATVPDGLTGVKAIAAGNGNSFALKSDGSIVGWGWNGDAQTTVPAGLTGVKAIAAGWYHTLALKNDGTVVAWGKNINGTTNVPSGLTGVVAIAAGAYHSLALKSDGTVIAWGDDGSGQISVPTGLSGVRAISAGVAFSLAVREDGTIVAWGVNNFGQINVPTGLTGIVAASGGYNHSIVLKCDGSTGTLNVGADSNVHPVLTYSSTVVSIIAGASAVISPATGPTDNGSVSSITVHSKGTFTGTVRVDAAGQVSISGAAPAGTHILTIHVTDNCGATTDATINLVVEDTCPTITVTAPTTLNGTVGTAYSQSFTSSGGDGTKIYTTTSTLPTGITLSTNGTLSGTPTQTGSFPITVTVTDGNGCPGTVMATLTISCPTIMLGTLQGGVLGEVYTGSVGATPEGNYTYEVTEGSLPVGLSMNSSTGFITGTPTVVGSFTFTVTTGVGNCTASKSYILLVSPVSAGGVIIANELSRTIGSPASNSTIATGTDFVVSPLVKVESSNPQNGVTLSGIVNKSGTVSANIAAACGAQNASFTLRFCDNSIIQSWGNDEFGQNTVPSGLKQVVAVSAGHYHNLALRSDGTVVGWGYRLTAPSGLSGVTAISAGGYHNLALKSDGTVVAWGDNPNGETTVPAGLTGVKAIAAGNGNSFALKSDGTIVGWGWNGDGQTTVPAGLTGVKAIAAGWYHTLALKNDGTVVAWGKNINGTTNVPSGLTGVVAIAAGAYHSLALKSDGTVVAWGDNGSGQISVPPGLTGVRAISAGVAFSLTVREDGTIVAWGVNNFGQVNVLSGLAGVVAASGGYNHSIILKCDGFTGTLDVKADPNINPVLTYSSTAVSITSGASAVINPVTGPIDNGSVNTITVYRKGTFTGTVGVDAAGQVSISGAAPAGTHILTIRATDNCGATTDATIAITVADVCPTILVTPSAIPMGATGTAYNLTFSQSGGAGTITWSLTGTLPSGLTFNPAEGLISGTPTVPGTYSIVIRATDGNLCFGERSYTLTIGAQPTYESDVATRPNGNGVIDVNDWVQTGRFVVRLDTAAAGAEFQRADSAPIETLGNGVIDVSDWVQAGRYAVGLNPLTITGGPTQLTAMATPRDVPAGGTIRAVAGDQPDTVHIILDARGTENAVGFTLRFDPGRVRIIEATSDLATLVMNNSADADGRIALAFARTPGTPFLSGSHRVVTLRIVRIDGRDGSPVQIGFDDSIIPRQMVDVDSGYLKPEDFRGGHLRIGPVTLSNANLSESEGSRRLGIEPLRVSQRLKNLSVIDLVKLSKFGHRRIQPIWREKPITRKEHRHGS